MGRMERINEMVKREVGKIIHLDLQDPHFQFVSITNVKVSPDLRIAWVSFSFLGEESQAGAVELALNHAAGFIRHLMSQRVELRHTPKIEFVYDPSLNYSANVEEILGQIKNEIPFEDGQEMEMGDE